MPTSRILDELHELVEIRIGDMHHLGVERELPRRLGPRRRDAKESPLTRRITGPVAGQPFHARRAAVAMVFFAASWSGSEKRRTLPSFPNV
jgi:hypothetical protein